MQPPTHDAAFRLYNVFAHISHHRYLTLSRQFQRSIQTGFDANCSVFITVDRGPRLPLMHTKHLDAVRPSIWRRSRRVTVTFTPRTGYNAPAHAHAQIIFREQKTSALFTVYGDDGRTPAIMRDDNRKHHFYEELPLTDTPESPRRPIGRVLMDYLSFA